MAGLKDYQISVYVANLGKYVEGVLQRVDHAAHGCILNCEISHIKKLTDICRLLFFICTHFSTSLYFLSFGSIASRRESPRSVNRQQKVR